MFLVLFLTPLFHKLLDAIFIQISLVTSGVKKFLTISCILYHISFLWMISTSFLLLRTPLYYTFSESVIVLYNMPQTILFQISFFRIWSLGLFPNIVSDSFGNPNIPPSFNIWFLWSWAVLVRQNHNKISENYP